MARSNILKVVALIAIQPVIYFSLHKIPFGATSVIGGFNLFDANNLRYLTLWLINIFILIPTTAYLSSSNRVREELKGRKELSTKKVQHYSDNSVGETKVSLLFSFLGIIWIGLLIITIPLTVSIGTSLSPASTLWKLFLFLASQYKWLILLCVVVSSVVFNRRSSSWREKLIRISNGCVPILTCFLIYTAAYNPYIGQSASIKKPLILFLIPALAVAWVILFLCIPSIRNLNGWRQISYLTFPSVIFAYVSFLPGPISSGTFSAFESFAFSNLNSYLNFGDLPWRDQLYSHGFYEDFARQLVAWHLGGPTIWGTYAAMTLVIFPIELLICYFMLLAIFKKQMALVGFSLFSIFTSWFFLSSTSISYLWISSLPRMLPFLFILFWTQRLINGKTPKINVFGLALSITVAFIFAEESIYGIAAAGIGVLVFDISRSKSVKDVFKLGNFKFTFTFLLSLVIAIPITITILTKFGVANSFLTDFIQNDGGYLFQGGMDIQWASGLNFLFSFFLVPGVIIFVIWKTMGLLRDPNSLTPEFTIVLISCICGVFYFAKFLLWPDWHLAQVTAVLSPVWLYFTILAFSNYKNRNSIAIVVATLFTVFILNQMQSTLRIDQKYTKISSGTVSTSKYGYIDTSFQSLQKRIQTLREGIVKTTGKSEPKVFDLTNSPALIYFLADFQPVPKTLFVATIFSERQQKKAIERIREFDPDLILWRGESGYFDTPLPGGVILRNYLIVQYVLDNYKPVNKDGGYIFFVKKNIGSSKNESSQRVALDEVKTQSCNWHNALSGFEGELVSSKLLRFKEKNIGLMNDSDSSNGVIINQTSATEINLNSIDLSQITSIALEVRGKGTVSVQRSDSPGLSSFNVDTNSGSGTYILPLGNCPSWNYESNEQSAKVTSSLGIILKLKFVTLR
jgi:hypothetical protein